MQNTNPKEDLVSIIVPVCNCEKYVKETIESVEKQTYKKWELIIIDDNSKDNSLKIIREKAKENKEKIKYIHLTQNKGVAIARNTGLEIAQGNYIAFLDGDDVWKENKLEEQIKFIKQNDYGFTFTSFIYLKENGNKDVKKIPKKITYKDALKNTIILTSTVIIDIKKIDKKLLIMPDIRKGQDTATWWQILKQGYIAYGLDKRLTLYRVRNNSLSFNKAKALKRTWNLYRNVEKFSVLKSSFYFLHYMWNATLRRLL